MSKISKILATRRQAKGIEEMTILYKDRVSDLTTSDKEEAKVWFEGLKHPVDLYLPEDPSEPFRSWEVRSEASRHYYVDLVTNEFTSDVSMMTYWVYTLHHSVETRIVGQEEPVHIDWATCDEFRRADQLEREYIEQTRAEEQRTGFIHPDWKSPIRMRKSTLLRRMGY